MLKQYGLFVYLIVRGLDYVVAGYEIGKNSKSMRSSSALKLSEPKGPFEDLERELEESRIALQSEIDKNIQLNMNYQKISIRFLEQACALIDINDVCFPVSIQHSKRIINALNRSASHEELASLALELLNRMEDELKEMMFIHVRPDLVEIYGKKELFCQEVNDAFPAAIEDIEEAGKCLALGLGTATVFHLMRAMECSVQALSKELGITNFDRVWGLLLKDINDKIQKMPPGHEKDDFAECSAALFCVKQAWRNPTMHPKKTYTHEQAT